MRMSCPLRMRTQLHLRTHFTCPTLVYFVYLFFRYNTGSVGLQQASVQPSEPRCTHKIAYSYKCNWVCMPTSHANTFRYACPLRMRIQLHTPARWARPLNYTGVPNAHAHTIVLAHCVCIEHTTAKTFRTTHAHTFAFNAQSACMPYCIGAWSTCRISLLLGEGARKMLFVLVPVKNEGAQK